MVEERVEVGRPIGGSSFKCICVSVYLCICVFVYQCICISVYLVTNTWYGGGEGRGGAANPGGAASNVFVCLCFCVFVYLCICLSVYLVTNTCYGGGEGRGGAANRGEQPNQLCSNQGPNCVSNQFVRQLPGNQEQSYNGEYYFHFQPKTKKKRE